MEKSVRIWSGIYLVLGVIGVIMGLAQLVQSMDSGFAMNNLGESWEVTGPNAPTVVYLLCNIALGGFRIALGILGFKFASLDKVWKPVLVLSIIHAILSILTLNIFVIVIAALGFILYIMYYNTEYKAFYGLR